MSNPTPAMPGMHLDVPYPHYAAWGHVRQSQLGPLLDGETPADYRYQLTRTHTPTDEQRLGLALDARLFSPDTYPDEVAVLPDWPKKSAADKARWADWYARHIGHLHISRAQANTVEAMVVNAYGYDAARLLLDQPDAQRQVSYVMDYPVRDPNLEGMTLRVQGRVDYQLCDEGIVMDLKTFGRGLAYRQVMTSCQQWHYFCQLALYREMARAAGWEPRECLLLAVQSTPPHKVRVLRVGETRLSLAWEQVREALEVVAWCTYHGDWPGYSGQIEDLDPA